MDSFLRRVIAQRELEQEEGIVATSVSDLIPHGCRVCGRVLSMSPEGMSQHTVCTPCGGRKRQARLEREDARVARQARLRRSLLSLVYPTQEEVMAELHGAPCSVCGKPLRADNRRGHHNGCKPEGAAASSPGGSTPPLRVKRAKDTKKNFRVITNALGFDGDKLLEEFMQGWLDRIKQSVRLPDQDDDLDASTGTDD